MARAFGFRQFRLLSFSSQRSGTITREYSQIISTSRWVKKVELYTSMLTCISQDGNVQCYKQRIQPLREELCVTPELTANASQKRIVRNNFGLKVVVEKVYVAQSKYVIGTASSIPPWKSSFYFS